MDGNIKLQLGLIWTLIRHYQIRSTGKVYSTKQAMLNWVNTLIPEHNVTNFSSDWNSGLALCALVDRIQPGLCPHHATLKPSNSLENCTLGMQLATDSLDIPQIIKPEVLNNQNVDETIVMTYLSMFCKPSMNQLLGWVKSKIPHQHVTNFKTDWNNGINLAAFIDAISPGLFPNWSSLDPHNALDNLTRAMNIAEQKLGVEPVLKPDEMADPNVDDLNVVTYISRFQNAQAIPLPEKCTASGPGLSKAFVGREATFRVDATRAGIGGLYIEMVSESSGSKISSEMTEEHTGVYKVVFTPVEDGNVNITIKWGNVTIPGSPYTCHVINTGSVGFTGPNITEGRSGKVGETIKMFAKGISDVSELQVMIQHESNQNEFAKLTSTGKEEVECSYIPNKVGKDIVIVKYAQQEIAGSPFEVHVVDPSKCSISHIEPPAGKAGLLGKPATFHVKCDKASAYGIVVECKTKTQTLPMQTSLNSDGSLTGTYSPIEVGTHLIIATCAGDNIQGSPLSLCVLDPKKVTILDNMPNSILIGKNVTLNISTKGAGLGQLEVSSSNQNVVTASLERFAEDMFSLNMSAAKLGSSLIGVTWSGYDIALTPFTIDVCDASKCIAYGKSLMSALGKVEELFVFTIEAKNAGQGELEVTAAGPVNTYLADIHDNNDGTYEVSFMSHESGLHSIKVTWGGEPISKSPFAVNFVMTDANQFAARGEGLSKCIAKERTQFILLGPEAGLVSSGALEVTIEGMRVECKSCVNIPPVSTDPNILVSIEDQGGGNYLVNYAVPIGGDYSIFVTCSNENISGSPFDLYALPAPDASKCIAFGSAIEDPDDLVVGKPLEFKVDTTNAGTGSINIVAYDPQMKVVPLFLAEEIGELNERIHVLKIEPRYQGKYTFDVKWSNEHVPNSPFKFEVGDPSKVNIISIPDQESFVAKIGEPFQVVVDTSLAGPGKLNALAKLTSGMKEPFVLKKQSKGQTSCSYTPREATHIELLLTYSDVNILTHPWSVDAVNTKEMKVTLLNEGRYGKVGEYVKFVISGMKKSSLKKTKISATHEQHSATVKHDWENSILSARFTAKQTGKYVVEAVCGQQHIPGSPFTVFIANPNNCKLVGSLPSTLALGHPANVEFDTAECGPGDLTISLGEDSNDQTCVQVSVIETVQPQKVILTPTKVGSCNLTVKWAGHVVCGTPAIINVIDPSKCTFYCPQLESKSFVKENEQVDIIVDATLCGASCKPDIELKGPKASYSISVTESENGTFTATASPWQIGKHEFNVTIADQNVPGSGLTFDVLKQISSDQIAVTGNLLQAFSGQAVPVTIRGVNIGSIERGQLTYHMTINNDTIPSEQPVLNCIDNGNGTCTLTYTAYDTGVYNLEILYENQNITGSPFGIKIKPKPCADKCIVSGSAIESGTCLNVKEQAQITVDTTRAGSGELSVKGKQPDSRNLRVFVNEEDGEDGEKLHHLIFDVPKVGIYTINVKWGNEPIPGSPFEIRVVDLTRCIITSDVPDTVQIDQSKTISIDSTGAGPGTFSVYFDGKESSDFLEADIVKLDEMDEEKKDMYRINFIGKALGESNVLVKWGGYNIQKTPFILNVCNAKECSIDAEEMLQKPLQVGVPFNFKVNSDGAGKGKLQIRPEQSSTAQYKIEIQPAADGIHSVTCTPWSVGPQTLVVMWGDEQVPDSPLKFSVCDPKKCKITGLPDTDYTAALSEEINFSIDYTDAGPGELNVAVKLPDESEEIIEGEPDDETKKIMHYKYSPDTPGTLQMSLDFNGISLLPQPWVCEVPDPTQFRVAPPKGMGKLGEPVRFLITGVTKQNQNFSISAAHLEHTASVTTEQRNDENTFISYFTPNNTGDYQVEVKHLNHNIDGSPFTVSVANPAGVQILTPPSEIIKVGEENSIIIDTSEGGPGELTCHVTSLSGDLEIEPQIISSPDEDGNYQIVFSFDSVGTCQLEIRWVEYHIGSSPYNIDVIDPSKVYIRCPELESHNFINQGDYLHFEINCCEAGHGTPQVQVTKDGSTSNAAAVYTTLNDNKDGTFVAVINPWQSGEYRVSIDWNGIAITEPQLMFEVHKIIDSRGITAHGDGLKFAIAGKKNIVVINAQETGLVEEGLLMAKCFDPKKKDSEKFESQENLDIESVGSESKELANKETAFVESLVSIDEGPVPITCWKDNEDGTYDLSLTYPYEGNFVLSIDYNEQPIYQSPFNVTVKGAPSADKCIVYGPSIDRMKRGIASVLSQQIEVRVDTTDAGNGDLRCTATDSVGDQIRIFTHEEDSNERHLHYLKFGPYDVGLYTMKLYWSDEPLPETPLVFSIVDPTRCLVKGLPLPNNGAIQLGDTIHFSIAPSNCGNEVPHVSITTHDKFESLLTLEETVTAAGVYNYTVEASEPENYDINVCIGRIHIPGSPFKCDIVDPSQFAICGLNIKGKYAYVGDTVSFKIQGIPPEGESFSVIAHGPHNDQICPVHETETSFHECSFPVVDPGSYEVYVECARKHVLGSPFQINVAEPSKCNILELPSELQVGVKEEIVVKTSEAGIGSLSVLINNEQKSSIVTTEIAEQSLGTYVVTLIPQQIEEVKLDILWAEKSVPQCPLNLSICDARQCKVFGQALMSKKGKVGESIKFTVVTHRAGKSKLNIKATGPSAQYTVTPSDIADCKFEAQFTPWQVGPHTIEIFWGKYQVPKSPYSLHVDKNSSNDLMCHAIGDGLKKAVATKPATFTLFSSEVGLLEKGLIYVQIQSALQNESVGAKITDQNDGSYQVTYVPPSKGAYLAAITFLDNHIPGSPFKINCVAGPDASKCHVDGLHQNTLYIAGKPVEFTVDTKEAGHGQLRVFIQGPQDHRPKVYLADDSKGIYSVKFDTLIPGKYFIVVVWSDSHVPGSPFKIRVYPGPDASKVKVTGPGTKDSYLGDNSELCIDTKEAGIGTLLIRVHGIKDAFKIQADPINESEPRILLATYSPKLPGRYDVFIRWSGVHVPGSPFKIKVKRKPGEKGETTEDDGAVDHKKSRSVAQKVPKQESQKPSLRQQRLFSKKVERRPRRQTADPTSDVSKHHQRTPQKQMVRSTSVGPIKPQLKMKKNPSLGQIGKLIVIIAN